MMSFSLASGKTLNILTDLVYPFWIDKREGCEVILSKNQTGYEGCTTDDNCKSTLRGASYATSIVSMSANEIPSWDQGFNNKGKQVWGATKGPYVFKSSKTSTF